MEIEILDETRLRVWCQRIEIPFDAVDELVAVVRQVLQDETLLRVFCASYEDTTLRGNWHRSYAPLPVDPAIQAILAERTSLFYYLLYLAALPSAEREYRRRGISMKVFDHTMSDLRIWLCHYKDVEGRWGFGEFGWIWHHVTCSLFRLGRLQFELAPFRDNVKAFRSRKDGQILILADPNLLLRPDGYALGAGDLVVDGQKVFQGAYPRDDGWRPVFEERHDGWYGHPISPYGWVERRQVFLPASEWELALQKGDPVLDMHIPRADPFTVEACRESVRWAREFYSQPGTAGELTPGPIRALFCHTWFFSPQLQQILPPESNIVHFQREFYLYPPFAGGPGFLWNFVFGDKVRDLASAPRDTSLRRAVLDWLGSGREIFDVSGVMFHSPEEWGTQPYMHNWDKLESLRK